MKDIVKIRFNTECGESSLIWRVILDDVEYLASEIRLNVPSFSSTDVLNYGRIKRHISANFKKITWDNTIINVD